MLKRLRKKLVLLLMKRGVKHPYKAMRVLLAGYVDIDPAPYKALAKAGVVKLYDCPCGCGDPQCAAVDFKIIDPAVAKLVGKYQKRRGIA